MRSLRLRNIMVAALLVSVLPALAGAETKRFGRYTVHYNAFTTDTLTATVAQRYGLIRSQNRALLNISVLQDEDNDSRAVRARVSATATNLNGQLRQLEVRELTEQEAIYYIAEMPVGNEQVYTYSVQITPDGESEPLALRFRQQFFTD